MNLTFSQIKKKQTYQEHHRMILYPSHVGHILPTKYSNIILFYLKSVRCSVSSTEIEII